MYPQLPEPDGTAEANIVPEPDGGYSCTFVSAWSEPLVQAYVQEVLHAVPRAGVLVPEAELAALRLDAERYRWLRELHWTDNKLGVVLRPKDNVALGSFVPNLELLDGTIDNMRKEPK